MFLLIRESVTAPRTSRSALIAEIFAEVSLLGSLMLWSRAECLIVLHIRESATAPRTSRSALFAESLSAAPRGPAMKLENVVAGFPGCKEEALEGAE